MAKKILHPSLYEINTRTWLNRFSPNSNATLRDVPDSYWQYLKENGMDYIWLMGVWKTNEAEYDKAHLSDERRYHYKKFLPDFDIEDVIGSPYAIDAYEINPAIATPEEFTATRQKLNELGFKLILDFVPNHFGKHSRYLSTRPAIFLGGDEYVYHNYPNLFFRSEISSNSIFAYGKDPNFGPWIDTVQVDYSKEETRQFMIEQLKAVAQHCDGLRCDMAMMILREIFYDSWINIIDDISIENWVNEFWEDAIKEIKSENPEFIFIAECYWDKEAELLQLGFDFCYDKKFTDQLIHQNIHQIKALLERNKAFQNHLLRFLENHDEERIMNHLDTNANRAAAVLLAVMPGIKLYLDGQWEGKRIHTSVHLGRSPAENLCQCPLRSSIELPKMTTDKSNIIDVFSSGDYPALRYPIEPICRCTFVFYQKLMRVVKDAVFKSGEWALLNILTPIEGPNGGDLIGISWNLGSDWRIAIINLSGYTASGSFSIFCNLLKEENDYYWHDVLNDQKVIQIVKKGMILTTHISLLPYSARILALEME